MARGGVEVSADEKVAVKGGGSGSSDNGCGSRSDRSRGNPSGIVTGGNRPDRLRESIDQAGWF